MKNITAGTAEYAEINGSNSGIQGFWNLGIEGIE
jgi:hypothetical protein